MSFVKSFLQDEQGQDLVEYSLLLAFIGLAAVASLKLISANVKTVWSNINTQMGAAAKVK